MADIRELAAMTTGRLFGDWGEPAQLLERRRTYDPDSGKQCDVEYAGSVRVVVAEEEGEGQKGPAALLMRKRRKFLLRSAELPVGTVLSGCRLRVGESTYELRNPSESSVTGVISVEGIRET